MKVNALRGVSDQRIKEVREATYESMKPLLGVKKDGWPEHKNDIPSEVRPHFHVRDPPSNQYGVV